MAWALQPFQHTWCGHDFLFQCHVGSAAAVGCVHVPDIMVDYVEVKQKFVTVCTEQGLTIDEVKDLCMDLIAVAIADVPRKIVCQNDIEQAKAMTDLARVVCFHLSKWLSYDFFQAVIAHFQPALKSVQERLMQYEDRLRVILNQKLEYIAKLQEE